VHYGEVEIAVQIKIDQDNNMLKLKKAEVENCPTFAMVAFESLAADCRIVKGRNHPDNIQLIELSSDEEQGDEENNSDRTRTGVFKKIKSFCAYTQNPYKYVNILQLF
jgi:hypothetical protein